MRRALLLCLALGGLAVLAVPEYAPGGPQEGRKGTVHVVKMTKDKKFDPQDLKDVKVGDAVKWVNEGGTHTATSMDITTGDLTKTFNTGTVTKGQEVMLYFNYDGTFKYDCKFHKTMTGTIVVTK